MNSRLLVLALLPLLSSTYAAAAPIALVKTFDIDNVFGFYVDGSELNGQFDTLFFQAKATFGTFINQVSGNQAGAPRPAGHAFTYPNNMLTADPMDFPGALSLTRVGLVNTPQELSYAAANLGGVMTTAGSINGDLFLGNINLSTGGVLSYQVQLLRAGNILFDSGVLSIPLTPDPTLPEPSSLSIAAIGGAVSLLAARRRRAAQI